MPWRPNKKRKGGSGFAGSGGSSLGKIGIDDFNTKGVKRGSQNELSFSVLHAKSHAADPVSSSSPNTVTRPAWELPPSEVENKKQARKRSKRLLMTAVCSAIAAALVVVGVLAFLNYQHSLDYVGRLHEELRIVQQAGDDLQPLESLMSSMLSKALDGQTYDSAQAQWDEIQPTLENMQEELDATKQRIESLQSHLTAADVETSNQGLTAIDSLNNIIDLSASVMEYALPAADAYSDATTFMDDLLQADSYARQASELVISPTTEKAEQSIDASENSKNAFAAARKKLENVQNTAEDLVDLTPPDESTQLKAQMPPTVNETGKTLVETLLSPYFEYIDTRTQAQDYAISSTNAYINKDKATVISATNTYNALENRAVAIISGVSVEPEAVMQAVYSDCRFNDSETFSSERARAEVALTAIDSFLS